MSLPWPVLTLGISNSKLPCSFYRPSFFNSFSEALDFLQGTGFSFPTQYVWGLNSHPILISMNFYPGLKLVASAYTYFFGFGFLFYFWHSGSFVASFYPSLPWICTRKAGFPCPFVHHAHSLVVYTRKCKYIFFFFANIFSNILEVHLSS